MTIIRACAWLTVLAATAWVWTSRRTPTEPFAGLEVVRDVVYRNVDGRPLRLDLILPSDPSDARRPLLIAVHGGSWTGGSRRGYAPQFVDLVREGLAVAVIDYRLARPGAPGWPGALEDVRASVDWLLARAERFGIDPDRVALVGTSAGGLLAAHAGQEDRRIAAVVCLSTPFDLAGLASFRRLGHEPVDAFLGAAPTDAPDLAESASPIAHVAADGPATLLIHGDDDLWVPIDQAREMQEGLEAVGGLHRLDVLPGSRHGFELQVGSPTPRDLTPEIGRFLDAAWAGPRRSSGDPQVMATRRFPEVAS